MFEIEISVEVSDSEGTWNYRYNTTGKCKAELKMYESALLNSLSGKVLRGLVKSALEDHKAKVLEFEAEDEEE